MTLHIKHTTIVKNIFYKNISAKIIKLLHDNHSLAIAANKILLIELLGKNTMVHMECVL